MIRRTAITLAVASIVVVQSSPRVFPAERAAEVRSVRADLAAAAAALEAGHTDEAGTLYHRALDRARSLAPADLLVARAADGLADAHRLAGRYREAEPLYIEAARLWERVLGPTQPRLATTLHNLGVTRWEDGRAAEAEPVLLRALSIWETALGADSAQAENTRRALRAVSRGSR